MNEIERNKETARKFLSVLGRGDLDALLDLYADDVVLITMGNTLISGTRKKSDAVEGAKMFFSTFPDGLEFTVKNMIGEGDHVAVEAESHGRHASGRTYNNQYHFLMRFRDGRLTLVKEYMDTEHATDALFGGQRPPARAS